MTRIAGSTCIIATLSLLAGCSPSTGGTLSGGSIPDSQWAAALDNTRGSAVQILADTCDRKISGTGFVIGRHIIVSNAHVLARAVQATIVTQSGHQMRITVSAVDADADLAEATTTEVLPPALTEGTDPVPGDLVRALGYPEGRPFKATSGRVIEYRNGARYGRQGQVLAMSSRVLPRTSGGPHVNSRGEVVGVVFALSRDDGNGLAIPISILKQPHTSPAAVASC